MNLGAFVASPAAVTPAHPDRHHNLLLQISGRKEVWVEDDPDLRRSYLREVSYFVVPGERRARVCLPARCYVMEPGDGVYIPPYAYHWTTVLGRRARTRLVGAGSARRRRSAAARCTTGTSVPGGSGCARVPSGAGQPAARTGPSSACSASPVRTAPARKRSRTGCRGTVADRSGGQT